MSKAAATDMRECMVAPITNLGAVFVVCQGAPGKSPGWNGISMGFYKTFWDVVKDDMLI